MYKYDKTDKIAAAPPLVSSRLLEQDRERIRNLHYSLKTETAYCIGFGSLCCSLPNRPAGRGIRCGHHDYAAQWAVGFARRTSRRSMV